MILFAVGRGEALHRFLVQEGAGRDERFRRLAQALSAPYPAGTEEKRWVDGVLGRKKGLGFRLLAACDDGMGTAEVAETFAVSQSWVRRLKQRGRETGTMAPRLPSRHGLKSALELLTECIHQPFEDEH